MPGPPLRYDGDCTSSTMECYGFAAGLRPPSKGPRGGEGRGDDSDQISWLLRLLRLLTVPDKWNDQESVRSCTNCWSYALDHVSTSFHGERKPQPGYKGGIRGPIKEITCAELIRRVVADGKANGRGVARYLGKDRYKCCSAGEWKIALYVTRESDPEKGEATITGIDKIKVGSGPTSLATLMSQIRIKQGN